MLGPGEGVTTAEPVDVAALFAAGDYTGVVRQGRPEAWQTCAALGLIGRIAEAREGLARFDGAAARFFDGAAAWIAGDEQAALRELRLAATPQASRLAGLIAQPRIHVLAQLAWTRKGYADLLTGAAADPKFVVDNISFALGDDLPNRPYADVHRYYDPRRPPDFYVCGMVEWHIVPPNVAELPCPVLGMTGDYDLHVQTVHPWLRCFDALVVTDSTERADVRRLVDVPVSTYPRLFMLPEVWEATSEPRDIDVFISGTIMHPYHPEKADLVHELLQMRDVEPFVVNGFLGARYRRLLTRSKTCLSFIRHPGAMPTRALEALSAGCVALVQRGSALTLYLGPGEGVVEYEHGNLPECLRGVLARWPEFETAAARGRDIVRREFAPARVASQCLRYLTVLAAITERRIPPPGPPPPQKRPVFARGMVLSGSAHRALRRAGASRWRRAMRAAASPAPFLDFAREAMLSYADRVSAGRAPDQRRVERILAVYRMAIDEFPTALVPRVNFVRIAVRFGDARHAEEARRLAEATLAAEGEQWDVDPMDDVFPWDFASADFDYREYFDAIVDAGAGQACRPTLRRVLLAALAAYVGGVNGDPTRLAHASRMLPRFPHYALEYVRVALTCGDARDRMAAAKTAASLIRHSGVATKALAAVGASGGADLFTRDEWRALSEYGSRLSCCVMSLDNSDRDVRAGSPAVARRIEGPSRPITPGVSIVVLDVDGRSDAAVLAALRPTSSAHFIREIIVVVCHDYVPPAVIAAVDLTLACGQDEPPHPAAAWNAGLFAARGEVICFVDAKAAAWPDVAAKLAGLDAAGPAAVAVAGAGAPFLICAREAALEAGGFVDDARPTAVGSALEDLRRRIAAETRRRWSPAASPAVGEVRRRSAYAIIEGLKMFAARTLPPRRYRALVRGYRACRATAGTAMRRLGPRH